MRKLVIQNTITKKNKSKSLLSTGSIPHRGRLREGKTDGQSNLALLKTWPGARWGWANNRWHPLQALSALYLYLPGEAFLLDSSQKRIWGEKQIPMDEWNSPWKICLNPLQKSTSDEEREVCVPCSSFVLLLLSSYYSWLHLCLISSIG